MQRLRDQECIRFLNAIEKTVPTKKTSSSTTCRSQTSQVITYPRVTFHFTPTSALMAERS
jgi:hypothetical protein